MKTVGIYSAKNKFITNNFENKKQLQKFRKQNKLKNTNK